MDIRVSAPVLPLQNIQVSQLNFRDGQKVWGRIIEADNNNAQILLGEKIISASTTGIVLQPGQNLLFQVQLQDQEVILLKLILNPDQRVVDFLTENRLPLNERWLNWLETAARITSNHPGNLQAAVLLAREGLPLKEKTIKLLSKWMVKGQASSQNYTLADLGNLTSWHLQALVEPGIFHWTYMYNHDQAEIQALVWEGEEISEKQRFWRMLLRLEQNTQPGFISLTASSLRQLWISFIGLQITIEDDLRKSLENMGWIIKRWSIYDSIFVWEAKDGIYSRVDMKG